MLKAETIGRKDCSPTTGNLSIVTFDELLNCAKTTLSSCIERIHVSLDGVSEEDFNRSAVAGLWPPAKIVEHLIMSNEPYLSAMAVAIASASPASGSTNAKHTFMGAKIRKAAGPSGKAPVPKAFAPKSQTFPIERISVLKAQLAEFLELADAASGKDLNTKSLRNPVFRVLRMNLVDCFGIVGDHTERHTRQIEERAARRL